MPPLPASTLPPGYSDHGVPGLICQPSKWSSVLLFYVANYLAHCATVKPYPAETPAELALAIFSALMFPSSGVSRALDSIARRPRLRNLTALERAAVAGALCMVVRTNGWVCSVGDTIYDLSQLDGKPFVSPPAAAGATLARDSETDHNLPRSMTDDGEQEMRFLPPRRATQSRSRDNHAEEASCFRLDLQTPPWIADPIRTAHLPELIMMRKCKIHGGYNLPRGYAFAFTKSAVAILQTVYASITLFRARGNQTKVYGYAAFGLTVVPYIMMSILNLAAQLVSPDFSAFYMVESEEMDEARRRGGVFDGAVGRLKRTAGTDGSLSTDASQDECVWRVTKELPDNMWELGRFDASKSTEDQTPMKTIKVAGPKSSVDRLDVNEPLLLVPTCSQFQLRGNETPEQRRIKRGWQASAVAVPFTNGSATLNFWAPVLVGLISLIIVGALSGFRRGTESTQMERGFTMSWLLIGMLFGMLSRVLADIMVWSDSFVDFITIVFIGFGVFLVPAVGGFVVVGKMIMHYGSCTRID